MRSMASAGVLRVDRPGELSQPPGPPGREARSPLPPQGDRTVEVETGDVIFIPARQPHFYKVLEAPFEFLCLVPFGEDQIRLMENREEDPTA